MSTHGTLKCYSLIINRLLRKTYPSFDELREFLHEEGFEISHRTLQRQFENVRNDFGVDIRYDNKKNGYFIDEEYSNSLHFFLRFIAIIQTADLLKESLKSSKDTLRHISFEVDGQVRGVEHLSTILLAIKDRRMLSFEHQNYQTGRKRSFTIAPLLLKEYQHRWYVIGKQDNEKLLRSFGIDRIENVQALPDIFVADPTLDPLKKFEHVIGLLGTENHPEEVELQFQASQEKYVESLPLHHSQQVISRNNESVIIRLTVAINYELVQRLLMYGDSVKILKPKHLVESLKASYQKALSLYR